MYPTDVQAVQPQSLYVTVTHTAPTVPHTNSTGIALTPFTAIVGREGLIPLIISHHTNPYSCCSTASI